MFAITWLLSYSAQKIPPGGLAGGPRDPNLGDKSGGFGRRTNCDGWTNRVAIPLRSPGIKPSDLQSIHHAGPGLRLPIRGLMP